MQVSIPQRLVADFSTRASLAQGGVRALYDVLCQRQHSGAVAALEEWKTIYALIGGAGLASRRAKFDALAKAYGIAETDARPEELLFSLHSYFALVVKLADQALARGCTTADAFDWIFACPDQAIRDLVQAVQSRLAQYDFPALLQQPWQGGDLFQPLYERLVPKAVRHALGEYYTPDWLAAHVLDGLGYDGHPDRRLLDPACGSGIFLLLAIRRVRERFEQHRSECGFDERELCRKITSNVVGLDLNPLAVLAARVNYQLALGDLFPGDQPLRVPVHQCDSILAPPPLTPFDYVAGNPPWVAWDNLPADYRLATRPLWERYGLFSLNGKDARHGGGKKDLSMLMLYSAADRHLVDGGRLGFVITQTLLQTGGAGDGFRRFRLGEDGPWLGIMRVDDLVALRPFAGAANWTCVLFLDKGLQTTYPVEYVRWSRDGRDDLRARPIEMTRPNSPWLIESPTERGAVLQVGPSDYVAHLGANSGGANGVYWVRILERTREGVLIENLAEASKQPVPRVRQVIEPDLLYPLARWSDVARYRIDSSCYLLLAQDPVTRTGIDEGRMRRDYLLTFSYLSQFEPLLRARAAFRRYQGRSAFYSMYNVDQYTLAAHKVIWRRMDKQLTAAVAGLLTDPYLGPRPIVPQETCVLVACDSADEAHYLCALLNSAGVNDLVRSHSVRGGKGFGTPSMLGYLNLRAWFPLDPLHQELARVSRRAHETARVGKNLS